MRVDTTNLKIGDLKQPEGLMVRAQMSAQTVKDYAADMRDGAVFPPIEVIFDGTEYWVGDGRHRIAALLLNGAEKASCNVRRGTYADALDLAIEANDGERGLRVTRADRRQQVRRLLMSEAHGHLSDREIAEKARVTHPTVAKVRKAVEAEGAPSSSARTGKDGRTRNVKASQPGQKKAAGSGQKKTAATGEKKAARTAKKKAALHRQAANTNADGPSPETGGELEERVVVSAVDHFKAGVAELDQLLLGAAQVAWDNRDAGTLAAVVEALETSGRHVFSEAVIDDDPEAAEFAEEARAVQAKWDAYTFDCPEKAELWQLLRDGVTRGYHPEHHRVIDRFVGAMAGASMEEIATWGMATG